MALGVLIGGLSGCNSNPEPPPLESASAAPSATPTPSAVPPELPAEAKGASKAAAKAFVRHWIDVLNYAGPAGQPEPIRAISAGECSACHAIADFIDSVAAADGEIAGQGWDLKTMSFVSFTPGRSAVIDVVTVVHPQEVRTSASATPERYPGGKRLKTFWLEVRDSDWALVRLDQPQ
ncbi:MAG: DUF6318 family protein [Actinomycetota bacterium]